MYPAATVRHRTPSLILLLALLAACKGTWADRGGGIHRKGEKMWSVRAHAAIPIKGKSLAWLGEDDVANYGVGAWNHWFVRDRIALGGGVSGVVYKPGKREVVGVELESNFRWYFWELKQTGFFWDFHAGVLFTENPIPPAGTTTTFSFAFGPGVEFPLGKKLRGFVGAQYHHISNALGRDSDMNPAQNEIRAWLSIGSTW